MYLDMNYLYYNMIKSSNISTSMLCFISDGLKKRVNIYFYLK